MCGRFFREGVSWADYHAALNITEISGVEPPKASWNIAPATFQPVVRLPPDWKA